MKRKILLIIAIISSVIYLVKKYDPELYDSLKSKVEETANQEIGQIKDKIQNSEQTNHNIFSNNNSDSGLLLEIPELGDSDRYYYINHWVNGEINYSLEYDTKTYNPRWVAFTFDDRNSKVLNIDRSNNWHSDKDLPEKYDSSELYKNSGYDRGHLVASHDREASFEANEDTFVYSNVSPQLHSFNAGMWKRLEDKVQSWGRNSKMRDIIYVVKGASLDSDKIEAKKIKNKMAIPKYFYMALIAKKNDEYHGIAFLAEHKEYPKSVKIKDLAISIDELENFIGFDLFPNFDDNIESIVESELPDSSSARKYWWRY